MRICSLKTAIFITMLTAFSCNMPPSFGPEYNNSSTNFIARLPLAAPVAYGDATTPFNTLATWDWAWRDGNSNTYEYMKSELRAGEGPGGSDAWLLTMENLGKDRVCANPTTNWTASTGATLGTETGALHGSSLKASFTSTSSSIYIDKVFFSDYEPGHSYKLFMNAKDADGLRYIEHSEDAYPAENLQTISGINRTFFIDFFPGNSNKLHLTKQNTNPVYLDDVSAIRTDVNTDKWALCLRLSLKDTEPSLVPGLYAFSVWVKKPDGYAFSTESGRGDNVDYASRFVTLSMIRSSSGNISPQTSKKSFDLTDPLVYPASGGWSRLELRLSKHEAFYFNESAEGQQIELRIACIGSSGADMEPGSILIAGPSLNFYKNGF